MANIAMKDIQFPGLNNVYTIPEVDNTLTQSGEAADAKKTGDEISALKQDLSEVIENVDIATNINTSSLFTKLEDVSASIANDGGSIVFGSNSLYDTYYCILQKPASIYLASNTSSFYVSLCYGEDAGDVYSSYIECSNPVRVRSSENNLPVKANPVNLKTGDLAVFTIRKGNTLYAYGFEHTYEFTEDAEEKILEISSKTKKSIVVYDNTVSDYETERLYIYIPVKSGYLRYNFAHYVNNGNNSNCWLIHPVTAVADDLSDRFAVTANGEFECAIKIDGAPDFMGGSSHGSEVMNSIHFFIDGKEILPSDITSLSDFEVLRIVEQSNLYDPTDEVTLAAIHGKEYIFTKDDLTINQSVLWSAPFALKTSYMAMLPIAKAVSPYYCPNDNYETYETAEEYIRRGGIDTVLTWSDTHDISVRFSIPKWDIKGTGIVESGVFLITDNDSATYNKQYYICTSGGSVQNGDLWRTITNYEFEIN